MAPRQKKTPARIGVEFITRATAEEVDRLHRQGQKIGRTQLWQIAYDIYNTHALVGDEVRRLEHPWLSSETRAKLQAAASDNQEFTAREYPVRWQPVEDPSPGSSGRVAHYRPIATAPARQHERMLQYQRNNLVGVSHRFSLTSKALLPAPGDGSTGDFSPERMEEIDQAHRKTLSVLAYRAAHEPTDCMGKAFPPETLLQGRHVDHAIGYGSGLLNKSKRKSLGRRYAGILGLTRAEQRFHPIPLGMKPVAPGVAYAEQHRTYTLQTPEGPKTFLPPGPGEGEGDSSRGGVIARVARLAVTLAAEEAPEGRSLAERALAHVDHSLTEFAYDPKDPAMVEKSVLPEV